MADGRPKRVRYIAGGLFIAGITVGCVFLVRNWQSVVRFQQYGYLGLFLMTFITGSPPPVPVPYMIPDPHLRGNTASGPGGAGLRGGSHIRGGPSLPHRARRAPDVPHA